MAASKATAKLSQSQRDDLLTYLTEDDGSRAKDVFKACLTGAETVYAAAVGNSVTARAVVLIERGLKDYEAQRAEAEKAAEETPEAPEAPEAF